MHNAKIILVGILLGAGLLLTGCHGRVYVEESVTVGPYYGDEVVYVHERPPAARIEIIPVCPGPDFIWIGGTWTWHDRWVWNSGHWARRPHHTSIWVDSHWSHHDGRWGYHRGHWKHRH